MPRGKNGRNNTYYSSTSYPPSPPAQLPTPLPDEHLLSQHSALYDSRIKEPEVLSPLIDFETPTPPERVVSLPVETNFTLGSDIDNDVATSRSPPFREARLPQDSPPPLPIRPKSSHWTLDPVHQGSVEGPIMADDRSFVGHSRTPTFSRPGTRTSSTPVSPIFAATGPSVSTLENLTRTIRGYVPSSIAISSSPSSPPSNLRGVDVGLVRSRQTAGQQEFERDYELHSDDGEEEEEYYNHAGEGSHHPVLHQPRVVLPSEDVEASSDGQRTAMMGRSGLAQAMQRNVEDHQKLPSDEDEAIIWASWNVLQERRLLIIGYVHGLQVWDCTNLSSVDEVLNLNLDSVEWRMSLESESSAPSVRVVHAAVLPSPSNQSVHGDNRVLMRLLGILLQCASEGITEQTIFFLYSLQDKHQVVKRLSFPGAPSTFVSNEHFIVISTTNPSVLYILSSTTFQTLHEISSVSLELFIPQVSFISPTKANLHATSPSLPVPTNSSGRQGLDHSSSPSPATPVPVFALSHRLLAYASSTLAVSSAPQDSLNAKETRRFSSSSNASPLSGSSASSSPFGFEQITGITRADVGHAALKVGETVFSGMKYIGGMALEAAKNRVASGQSFDDQRSSNGSVRDRSSGGRFVSRSAPDHLSVHDEPKKLRRSSSTSIGDPHSHPTKVAPSTKPSREKGHHVTIVDLAPLHNLGKVSRIDEILVSTSQPAAKIEFSADGTSVGVALRDGHSMKVFKLKPSPRIDASSSPEEADERGEPDYQGSTQVYDLHRGMTSAIIECIVWAVDGRYVGISTRNRTVHIYAVNPYGGKADLRSHLEGHVRNVEAMDYSITSLTPIARLRGSKTSYSESQAALTFTFIPDAELVLASHLLPSSPNRKTRPITLSPPRRKLGTNYQHILLFNPEDGVLSLYRLTLEKNISRDPIVGGVAASIQALGVTSMSFPGPSNLGRLSTSPSAKPIVTPQISEPSLELGAKSTQVATYNLKRGRDWDEVIKPLETRSPRKQSSPGGDWLAEAELSTCSSSQQVIPRSIYLSHQFSFHTLGEDYHALIRRYQLNVSGNKIDVRKEVEIRTSALNIATFAEGFSPTLDTQRDPSSFDEPISSAISGSFDNSNIPRILPMYPNGIPGANVKSLRNSIHIRAISGLGDGVSERIRKEMHRVRSPRVTHRSDTDIHASVPLEFDEEEFLEHHGESVRDGGNINQTSLLSSTQKLLDADIVGSVDEELFSGWDVEDKQAIDEVEQFQDIAVASYIVEDEGHRQQDKRKVHLRR